MKMYVKMMQFFMFTLCLWVLSPASAATLSPPAPDSAYADEAGLVCRLYPIGVEAGMVDGAVPGSSIEQMPTGNGTGNYSFLTWAGGNDVPTLAASLIAPGDVESYINPDDPGDNRIEVADWVQGGPGVMNSRAVRDALDALIGVDIVLPLWRENRKQGSNFDYLVDGFAVVELTAYKLKGKGWISFIYKGRDRCYNTSPTVADDAFTTPEDTPLSFTASALDADADPLRFEIITPVTHGVLEGDGPDFTYTPHQDFVGTDQFVYTVTDGYIEPLTATVTIEVTPVNDPPVALDDSLVTDEDTPLSFSLQAYDIDSPTLSYEIVTGTENGTLNGEGADLLYTPNADYFGPDQLTFKVSDGELYSNIATIRITVNPVNDDPFITSTPVVSVINCYPYHYTVTAEDVDHDTLTFSLISAPDGMVLDATSGVLQWDIPVPGHYTVTVEVSDGQGGVGSQTFVLEIINSARELSIISAPVTSVLNNEPYSYAVAVETDLPTALEYRLLVRPEGMTITAGSGEISWQPAVDHSQGIVAPNPYCAVSVDPETGNEKAAFADVVTIVDESGSMSGEHRWIGEFVSQLEPGLLDQNVGGNISNQYGLVGFERSPREIPVGDSKMGSAEEFVTAAGNLRLYGGTEDGWRALRHVVETYPLRDDAAKNLILVTDEDRDYAANISYDDILTLLQDNGVLLNAVVNASFRCDDGRRALGIDSAGGGYVADNSGGFTTCSEAVPAGGSGNTIAHYVNLALETGGAAWDLNYLRSGGHWAQSFSAALIEIKVNEIVRQTLALADLTPTNINVNREQSTLSVEVLNRGGAAIQTPVTVQFFSIAGQDLSFLGEVVLADGVQGNGTVPVTLPLAEGIEAVNTVAVRVVTDDPAAECHTDNNFAVASAVVVEVDGGCSVAQQSYAVNVFEANLVPYIQTVELSPAEAEHAYTYTLEAGDPNLGDSLNFSLDNAPDGMRINAFSGQIDWLPEVTQKGTHEVVVSVRDIAGLTATAGYSITVTHNYLPEFTSQPSTLAVVDQAYSYTATATDLDGDTLTYTLRTAPANMTLDAVSGVIAWLPALEDIGTHDVAIVVADGQSGEAVHAFTLTVRDNEAPVIAALPGTDTVVGDQYQYVIEASDPDGDPLTYQLITAPAGMTLDETTGMIEFTPATGQTGTFPVVILITDNFGGSIELSYELTVLPPNTPPIITSTPLTSTLLGTAYSYAVEATDADGHVLTYALSVAPAGMSIDDNTGLISWLPAAERSVEVSIQVTDTRGASATQSYILSVVRPNDPPAIITTPGSSTTIDQPYTYDVDATDPDGDPITYSLEQAPSGMLIDAVSGVISWTPTAAEVGEHPVSVKASDDRGAYVTQTYFLFVTEQPNEIPTITSTPPQWVMVDHAYSYDVEATDADGDPIEYTLEIAPTGMTINAASGVIAWAPTVTEVGEHTVTVKAADNRGAYATQSYTLFVTEEPNNAPQITTTPGYGVTISQLYRYDVNAIDPNGDPIQYSLETAPVGMTIDPLSGLIEWTPSATAVGQHAIAVKAADDRGAYAIQSYTLVVTAQPNDPPVITTTPDFAATVDQPYSYDVDAGDPDGDLIQYNLEQAPSGMLIDAVSGVISWTPTLTDVGEHTVTIKATDNYGTYAIQSYTLFVTEQPNAVSVITSTPAEWARATYAYSYQVVASDADGDTLSYSLTQSPVGMTIDDNGLITWIPDAAGQHLVTVRISDGKAYTEQSWILTISEANAPLDVTVEINPSCSSPGDTITINVTPIGAIGTVTINLLIDGVAVTPDSQGSYIKIAGETGIYPVEATVTDNQGSAHKTAYYRVVTSSADCNALQISLEGIADNAVFTAPSDVTGSIYADNLSWWRLGLLERGAPASELMILAEGTEPVVSASVDQLDPTMLLNGQYTLILQAGDTAGNIASDSRVISVEGDLKVGHFSITFEDLTVPTAGIPITLARTYDTRQRHKALDFGQGWSLTYQNVRIYENMTPGFGWIVQTYPGPFGIVPKYCVESNGDRIVSITLENGEVKKFKAKASPECNQGAVWDDVDLVFEPIGADNNAKLEALNENGGLLTNGSIEDPGYGPINPSLYKLTTETGLELIIDQNAGLRELYEPEGDNRITISQNGILHSAGPQVTFVRDTQDRITQIIAPDGTTLNYTQDANNDLTAFTDQKGNTTQFTYLNNPAIPPHYLEDIIDPRGIRVARNEYDDDGRLIAHIDAEGNRTELNHDITGRIETVTDARGNNTVYIYDERGNVLSETNALGETITRTYDAYGNELSRTDAEGNTQTWTYDSLGNQLTESDGEGNTVTNAYGVFNQFMTQTDPTGHTVISNWYHNKLTGGEPVFPGPLTRITDALGNITYLDYNSQGRLTGITDAAGYFTQTEYDANGYTTAQIDANGTRTDYVVDDQGRTLSETTTRTDENGIVQTLTTSYVYDAKGNVIQTTDPAGHVTRTEYNAIDKISASVDANGVRTEYGYDARGNQNLIRYADGTTETTTYDVANNKISETDRAGRTTKYVYDAANRLTETVYPDGTPADDSDNPRMYREYDGTGKLIRSIDAKGNATQYQYDAAGRNTHVTDALGHTTEYQYDSRGNRTAMIDALGHETRYVYDAANRLIETIQADDTPADDTDNPRITTGYDALGRKTGQTDQAGRTTQYEYDAVGNLIAIIDPLGQRTEYGYDERGNKISQIDAGGRTTTWAYDNLGRQTSRTLPEGQTKTFTYDTNGNKLSHTNFNGNTTTYAYEADTHRLSTVTDSDGTTRYTYSPTGRIETVTDQNGTVSYQYDTRYRLIQQIQADGAVLAYTYDANGNTTTVSVTRGGQTFVTQHTYDELNRLVSTTDHNGNLTAYYTYDAVGNRETVNYPNGTWSYYRYNERNQLTELRHTDALDNLVERYSYSLDSTGRRIRLTEDSGRVTDYVYDDLYRLTGETITDLVNGNYSASYQYDAVGNRIYEIVNGVHTAYTYDSNDRLQQQGGTIYTYDDNGNTLSETLNGNTVTYSYDAGNRLVQVTQGGISTDYAYNHNGIRISKTEGGVTTVYTVDENRDYAQVVLETTSAGQVVYTYGDDLISQDRDGVLSLYHYDGLGSTRFLSDAGGAVTDRYDYTAFGGLLNQTGGTENLYLFAGEQFDGALGLYYLRARYYDQGSGRFTQMDSWVGSNYDPIKLHKYLYANVDPVTYTDPTGNFSIGSFMSAINVMGTLYSIASTTYNVFQIASGEKDMLTAREAGSAIILNMLGSAGGKVIGFFGKKVVQLYTKAGCTGKRNSFIAGTLVSTNDGIKPIEDIKIGDMVWAYDVESGQKSLQKIVHLIEGDGEQSLVDITLVTGEKITATDNHPFWVVDKADWVLAKYLDLTSLLLDINNNTLSIFKILERSTENTKVYNLTVNDDHTYYVGESTVLNHNCTLDNLNFSWKSVKTFGHTFNTHGAGKKNTKKLIDRARGTGNDQGQWQDNEKAAELLKGYSLIADGPTTVPIPLGIGKVIKPDGSMVDVAFALVVPNGNGTFRTAYPVIGKLK